MPPADSIRVEIARGYRGHLNLYQHATGYRADVYLAGRDPLDSWSLDHAVRMPVEGGSIALAPPETVIVRKLEYFREGGSEKHVRDIHAILANQEPLAHRARMETWIAERGLEDAWQRALENFEP